MTDIEKSPYYDGSKLLSLMDVNGNKPEMYFCTTNRAGGKTTYFNRLLVKRFIKQNKKFMILLRWKYETSDIANKFFGEIQRLFFPDYIMTSKSMANGIYEELFLAKIDSEGNEIPDSKRSCGYAVALQAADNLKKMSHLFADVDSMLMDEFQSEQNHYCPNEISKFRSIHATVARGGGKQIRYVPVYLLSNPVSLMNPYYCALNISCRLQSDTNFLRGDGFVLEQGFNEAAAEANKASAFNRAFGDDKYSAYQNMGAYLNSSENFIEKPKGDLDYYATISYNGRDFGCKYCTDGYYYIDDKPDMTFPVKWCFTTPDHQPNKILLQKGSFIMTYLRKQFNKGQFRFKNLDCKEALFYGIGQSLWD